MLLLFIVWRCRFSFVYVRVSAKLTTVVFVSMSNYTEIIISKNHENLQTLNILQSVFLSHSLPYRPYTYTYDWTSALNETVKVKVIPQQAEVAQGVPDFLDVRHYKGGRSSALRTGRLYPRRNPRYSFSEAESTRGHMVLSGVPRKKSPVTPPGIDPGTFRLVA